MIGMTVSIPTVNTAFATENNSNNNEILLNNVDDDFNLDKGTFENADSQYNIIKG